MKATDMRHGAADWSHHKEKLFMETCFGGQPVEKAEVWLSPHKSLRVTTLALGTRLQTFVRVVSVLAVFLGAACSTSFEPNEALAYRDGLESSDANGTGGAGELDANIRALDDESIVERELGRAIGDPLVRRLMEHLRVNGCATESAEAIVAEVDGELTVLARSACGNGYAVIVAPRPTEERSGSAAYALMETNSGGSVVVTGSDDGLTEQSYDTVPTTYGLTDILKVVKNVWPKLGPAIRKTAGSAWNFAYCMLRCGAGNASRIVGCAENPANLTDAFTFITCVAPTAWGCMRECL
jgi:hypothetical protein